MSLETLRLVRNILLRSVVIGIFLAIILATFTFAAWDTWTGLATKLFHTDEATLSRLVVQFFVEIRFYLLFVLLAPGLAIHWTLKAEQSKQS